MAPHRLLGAILLIFVPLGILLRADEPADAEKPVQAAKDVRTKAPPPPQIANPVQQLIRGFFQQAVPAAKVAPAARAARVRGNVNKVMEDGEGEEQPVRVNPSDRDYIDSRAPHDAKIEHQLSLAQAAIKRNDWKQAAALLQQLLDLPEDSLHRLPDGRWQSVRVTASRELGHAPAEVLIGYQQQYGGLAKQILTDADAEGDIAGVIRVATRFFHTEAGYQAAERLALVHRDRAEFGIAAQWLDQLLAARVGFTKNPGWKALAAAIYRQAGRAEDAKKLADGLNSEIASLKIGGQSSDVARWLESLPGHNAVKPLTLESWPQFAGTSDRTGLQTGSAPFLMAEWHVPYSSSHGVRQRVKWLMQDLADRDQPLMLSAHPLAIDGKILYRDLRGVHAVDLATGESLWETIEGMSAEKIASGMTTEGEDGQMVALQVVNGFMDPFGGQSGDHHPLTNLMLRDAAYNTVSSDGGQVFLIEDQGILTRQNGGWHWGWDGEQPDPYGFSWTTNRLSSYDINTGRPLWTVGGPETAEAFQLPLAGVYFHGVPTPDGDDLFAIGSKGDELRLWCLDRRTGGLRWSQLIGYADSRIDQDIARRWMPALPSVSGGVVVCPTNLGWLVAVDRLRQTVLWAVRYQPPQQANGQQQRHPGQQLTPQHELGGQWGASAPLIVGQKVVFAPAEDQFLICVDLVSGAPAWQLNRDQGQYVAGTTGDAIIIVELQQVCAYAMNDGRKLWTHPFGDNARPSGRGAMTETQFFLPLSTGELRTVSLADGKTALQSFVPAGESPLGNLLLHQGRMASLGYEGLTGFRQQEALLAEIRERKAKNPADPVALLNEAEIHLLNRQSDQAVPLLKGISAAELPGELAARHHRDLIAGLTAMIRQNLVESEPLLAELSAVAATPAETLLHQDLNAERYLAAGSHQAAFEIFWNLVAEPGEDFVIRPDDARVQTRRAAWLAGRLHDAWKGASEQDRRQIDELIAARVSQTVGDGAARRRLADTLRFHPQSHGLWRDLIIGDDSSLAELELLRWTESGDQQMAAWAWTWLANLMVELNLPADAAYYASKLAADHAETKLPDGRTGAETVEFLRTTHQLPADFTAPPPAWDERPLKVVQSMHQYYGQQSQEIGPSSRMPFFESLDIEFLPNEQRLMFESRNKDFRWLAPLRISPVSQHNGYLPAATLGHLLAVVHQDVLHLLSPVKRQMLWSVSLDGFSDGGLQAYHASRTPMVPMWNAQQSGGMQAPVLQQYSNRGRLATAQTGYVAVIGRRAVHVLDSRTGTEIWRRNNVTPHSRVIGGPDILWIVPNNLAQVSAYRTADGTPIAGDKWGELFGRCLGLAGNDLLLAEEGVGIKLLGLNTTKTVVRRFDPLAGKDVWKQEFGTGAMLSRLSDDELLVVPASGAAEILSVARGERKPLEALTSKDLESRSDCYAVADEDRVFLLVNTQQNGGFQHFAESLPSVRANGAIYAWQRSTGKLIWKHELKNQHLIVERMQSSPVLLFCSREWKQKGNVNFSQLHLAVLHKQTGKLLHESTTPTMYGGFHALAISPNEQSLELQSYNLRVKLVPDDKPADKPALQGSD